MRYDIVTEVSANNQECWWISFLKWSEEIIFRNKYTRIVVIKNVHNRNSFRYRSGDFIFSDKRNAFRKPSLHKIWAFGLARQNFWEQLRARNVKMCTTMLTFSHCNTKRFFLMWMPPSFSIHLQEICFLSWQHRKGLYFLELKSFQPFEGSHFIGCKVSWG